MSIEKITKRLISDLEGLQFAAPVTHVYNPLVYAGRSHSAYLRRFASKPKEAIFLGMNPGPWGMAQTGIPFGEIAAVRDWMNIREAVGQPPEVHPKRPILGLECTRSEVSGARLWNWAQSKFKTPESFFDRFFVANYCPLSFMEESGKNRTPDKLPASERIPLFQACDRYLQDLVKWMEPDMVIGVGAFAEARAKATLSEIPVQIGRILHPSPASPIANRGWAERAMADLHACGIQV